jgi:hypothetical protein
MRAVHWGEPDGGNPMKTLPFAILLLVACAFAQDSKPTTEAQRLQKAILMEEGEKNLAEAKRLYEELVAGAKDPAVAQEAKRRGEAVEARMRGGTGLASTQDSGRAVHAFVILLDKDEAAARAAQTDLVMLGDASVPVLANALRRGNELTRMQIGLVVKTLAMIRSPAAGTTLVEALDTKDAFVRRAIAGALAEEVLAGGAWETLPPVPALAPVVERLLVDESAEVRQGGGALMGRLSTERLLEIAREEPEKPVVGVMGSRSAAAFHLLIHRATADDSLAEQLIAMAKGALAQGRDERVRALRGLVANNRIATRAGRAFFVWSLVAVPIATPSRWL